MLGVLWLVSFVYCRPSLIAHVLAGGDVPGILHVVAPDLLRHEHTHVNITVNSPVLAIVPDTDIQLGHEAIELMPVAGNYQVAHQKNEKP